MNFPRFVPAMAFLSAILLAIFHYALHLAPFALRWLDVLFVVAVTVAYGFYWRENLHPFVRNSGYVFVGIGLFFVVMDMAVGGNSMFKGTTLLHREGGDDGSKKIDTYFETIRNDPAALTVFFSAMPKGGDLHNHISGSIYAETYLLFAARRHFLLDTLTLTIDSCPGKHKILLDTALLERTAFGGMKQKLMREWSIRDYYDGYRASDQHFFDAFGKFPAGGLAGSFSGLEELKNRAKIENVQYLEVMTGGIKLDTTGSNPCAVTSKQFDDPLNAYNDSLRWYGNSPDTAAADGFFGRLYTLAGKAAATDSVVNRYLRGLRKVHQGIDDSSFAMRFLISLKRDTTPAQVFRALCLAFQAAARNDDSLIAGINFVTREDGQVSMEDYHLHMKMFRFLEKQYKNVRVTLHAGELTMGLVRPEDLTYHIHDALFVGGARRIGHGTDLAYEKDCNGILKYMRDQQIAVEINLWSNDFILKVRGSEHPIMLYKRAGVPIVICTDDAGILRSNLLRQYVLLAQRYPELSYSDIRQFVLNSIEYSFIQQPALRQTLKKNLEDRLARFEETVLKEQQPD